MLTWSACLAWGKHYETNFLSFELPVGWECVMEGTEYVCQSEHEERKKEAIIIFAAKIRGKNDSLEYYQSYLKKKKTYNLPGGKTQVSDPKYARVKEINSHRWVDALHLSSEIPGFYTRYLATVKKDLGVAMTFTVSRQYYNTYKTLFDKVVSSLRVFRKGGDIYDKSLAIKGSKKGSGSLLDDASFIPDEDSFDISSRKSGDDSRVEGSQSDDTFFYIIIILVAVAAIFLKKRKH
ncbi:MAG: hypothetical protein H6621_03620 [Halobacteriovoraceae bacterium]|nr:hypothetical protein [Halobacteriovoraceae bacterium]